MYFLLILVLVSSVHYNSILCIFLDKIQYSKIFDVALYCPQSTRQRDIHFNLNTLSIKTYKNRDKLFLFDVVLPDHRRQ